MDNNHSSQPSVGFTPWNKGKLIGQKPPPKRKEFGPFALISERPWIRRALFVLLGIERAHLVGCGTVGDLINLCVTAPDLVASLTLVCPMSIPRTAMQSLSVPFAIVVGDRGKASEMIEHVLTGCSRTVLANYDPLMWSDVAAERPDDVRQALFRFLEQVERQNELSRLAFLDEVGSIAEVRYRVQGEGVPIVFFPLGLAPSQWQPLLPDLTGRYRVVSVSGAHIQPTSILEDRASSPEYQAIVASVMDRLKLTSGQKLLEVGCGSGAVSRQLAEITNCGNPIVGVDVNSFLLNEAASLRDEAGLGSVLTFQEGNAYSLPFPDASFAGVISITLLEEVDADRALAEMVRVVRPGGQVGVAVRAIDIPPIVSAELPEPILAKVRAGLHSAGASPGGCADASLYRRMVAADLTDLSVRPQFNCSVHRQPLLLGLAQAGLDPEELDIWTQAIVSAGEAFFMTMPMHVAIGTRPNENE